MAIALTCSCSARLEIDDRFAGQTITCPDCQKPLEVPLSPDEPRRTSGFALTSLILALVGAFTVVGTVLAVIAGVVALLTIRNAPKQLAGKNFAVAGIILGSFLTLLSVFAYTSGELFGVDGVLRESQWAGKLDYPADLEIKRSDLGYKIKRPSPHWGVYWGRNDGTMFALPPRDMLLVLPSKSAYVVCMTEDVDVGMSFDQCQERGIQLFTQLEVSKFNLKRNPNLQVHVERGNKRLWNKEENSKVVRFMEMKIQKTYHGQTKTFLLRVIKKEEDQIFGKSRMYVIAGGAPAAQFDAMRKELLEALDSFQITD
jgi:hypothetical protein